MTTNEEGTRDSNQRCLGCRGPLSNIGVESFRVGGTSGGWKLLFGELAEVGEQMLDLEVFVCERCRRVELRMPTRTESA